jgi:hypothetical protein
MIRFGNALRHGYRSIIYVIPYTSVIEQDRAGVQIDLRKRKRGGIITWNYSPAADN